MQTTLQVYCARLRSISLYFCLPAFLFFGLQRLCYLQTDGFALYKIFSTLAPKPAWEMPPLSMEENKDLLSLLNQPFHYLGKGSQTYAFASQDEQIVIKFRRFNHLRHLLWFHRVLPAFVYEKERIKRLLQKRTLLEKEFSSYKIAFTEMKEETGLLYVHLNRSSHLKQKITLYDKSRVAHQLDLDSMQFVVQKKATPFYSTLSQLASLQEEDTMKTVIDRFLSLLTSRCSKGIYDKDPDLNTNFGFLDNKPIQIDVGDFYFRETPQSRLALREEIERIAHPFNEWLKKYCPALSSYLLEEINHLCPSESSHA